MLNYKLLIVCVCIVIGLVFYLFYLNRLLGYLIGLAIRFSWWNQGESSVWVDIGSIDFSLRNGRILLKDLRYHSSNQTIKVVKGQLSWRYWIRTPAEEEDLSHARVVGEPADCKNKRPLSCRVHISLHGLEWFLYNRTAAYDHIISAMEANTSVSPRAGHYQSNNEGRTSLGKIFSRNSATHESSLLGPTVSLVSSLYDKAPSAVKRSVSWVKGQLPNLDPKQLLPFSIEATKAAIICGNASTPSLLVAEFQSARGTYGIVPSRSKFDLYKQQLNLKFQKASLCYVDNRDYQEKMTAAGAKLQTKIATSSTQDLRHLSYLSFSTFHKLWIRLKLWTISASSQRRLHIPIPHPTGTWPRRKPTKTKVDETPVGPEHLDMEYAKESKVLDVPVLELLYYADVVGFVPPRSGPASPLGEDPFDIGNGDSPPEWGIDLALRGGFIRYGPWADRQRTELQHAFFPPSFLDLQPHARLKPGESRVWTNLKVLVELRDGVTLQIPFREASKNWQWDGQVKVPNRPRKREAASIHIKAGDNSTIGYIVPMVAGPRGYEPILEVHLDTVTVTTSLNDIRLLTAESCRVRCEMPSPLRWNEQRKWAFNVSLRQPLLYLLRDHVNMLTDLGRDWSAGPPSDYNRFVPMLYAVELEMQNYEINTYVNDHNIIDKPLIRDENALLTLRGKRLTNGVQIPLTKYRPDSTAVSFWITVPDVAVNLELPRWNTHSLYPTPHRTDVGRIGLLQLDASYRYHSDVRPENSDQLKLQFQARDVVYKANGWTIRHFMILKDNYFGSFTHFSTLFEYLEKRKTGQPVGDPIDLQWREGHSNSLHVDLGLLLDSGLIIVPAGLPGYEVYNTNQAYNLDDIDMGAALLLALPELQVQLRTNDYYMDMSLNIDTVKGSIEEHCSEKLMRMGSLTRDFEEAFIIDGIDITANRLFGPQPHTSTYLCIWEIHVGGIVARLSASEGRIITVAGGVFGLNFTDPLNAPAAEYAIPELPDVTFLKVSVDSINVVWHVANVAAEISLPEGLRMDSNDVPGKAYRKVTSIRVPELSVRTMLASQTSPNIWYETMELIADGNLDIYSAPRGWTKKAQAQTEFLAVQDRLTRRACFLYQTDTYSAPDVLAPGRGLLDTDLYLPQIRVPSRTSARPISRSRMQSSRARVKIDPSRLYPPVTGDSQVSESDGEEGVSEADRDVRLANSRPQTLGTAALGDHDESMSSGDESDDEDLTDPPDYDSDESNLAEESYYDWLSVSKYRRFTRHFRSHNLGRPSLWDDSPFILSKECDSVRGHLPREHNQLSFSSLEPLPWHACCNEQDDSIDTTVVRCLSEKTISFLVTPLVLVTIEPLLGDIRSNQLSPELRFDAMMAQHVQASAKPEMTRNAVLFDLQFASVQARTIQLISNIGGAVDDKDDESASMPSGHRDTVSSVDISAIGLQLRGKTLQSAQVIPPYHGLTCSVNQILVGLAGPGSQSPTNIEATSRITLDRSSLALSGKDFKASLGNISVNLDHNTPECVATTVFAIMQYMKPLVAALRQSIISVPALEQRIIHEVIRYSQNRIVVDPLSTIQPSYLIQSGRPHELRTDIAFKFLVYLRNCLRYLEICERDDLLRLQPDGQPMQSRADLLSILEKQLLQFGLDIEIPGLLQYPLLAGIFPNDDGTMSKRSGLAEEVPALDAAYASLGSVRLTISHPGRASSEFLVAPLTISVHERSMEYLTSSGWNIGKNAANLATRDKGSSDIRHLAFSVIVGDVTLTVVPQLLLFVQLAFRAKRDFASASPSNTASTTQARTKGGSFGLISRVHYVDLMLHSRSFRITAAAENLIIEYKACGVTFVSTLLARPSPAGQNSKDLSMNNSLKFAELRLQASAVADLAKPNEYATLASFTLTGGGAHLVLRQEPRTHTVVRITTSMDGVHLNVPRSAMRLYRFVEDWKADYFPGIDSTMRALLSEMDKAPGKTESFASHTSDQSGLPAVHLQSSISSVRVSLQVVHGMWLSWEICQTLAYLSSPTSASQRSPRTFGLQIGSHAFSTYSKAHTSGGASPSMQVKFALPTFALTGHHDGTHLHSQALVEFFHVTVKPSHWDTLLSVQQKFGQGFNDFVSLIEETQRRQSAYHRTNSEPLPDAMRQYDISIKMKGFRAGLEGLSSTLFLECEDISGGFKNDVRSKWHINVSGLALSLAPHSKLLPSAAGFNRDHRSAFVIIDFQVNMGQQEFDFQEQLLKIAVTKIHAVMQPSSIGELGDFVDYLQAEVLIRKEDRAKELADFKEKTRKVMRTFDTRPNDVQPQDDMWWADYTIDVHVRHIGIAFPIASNRDLQLPRAGSRDAAVRAFLFSIQSITFSTQRGETGQARMKGFSFQFVSRFSQSVPGDFSGENHPSRNRLRYPEMAAQIRSERLVNSRRIRVWADVDGFILDIDSNIPDYVASLIEVYRKGKERVERLSNLAARSSGTPENTSWTQSAPPELQYSALPRSNILLSLTFASGKVRMYSKASTSNIDHDKSRRSRKISTPMHDEPTDDYFRELGAEIFNLPVVSVWGEFRATPTPRQILGATRSSAPSTLLFKSTIHSSQNSLRPTLLPFLTELLNRIEDHMNKAIPREPPASPALMRASLPSQTHLEESPDRVTDSVFGLQISLSLRIDQSKLELTCQPDVNVIAGLHWDSGGFVVNISPGAHRVTFTGSVGGLTAGLKHGFLSDDCVRLDARNLAFTVDFAKLDSKPGEGRTSIAVVLDTELSGGVRFSRLQDVLCFKAVWLDRLPTLNAQKAFPSSPIHQSSSNTTATTNSPTDSQFLTTVLLLRLRRIRLDVDLGQSISSLKLDVTDALIRTKMTESLAELSLSVSAFSVAATGNLSGHVIVPDFRFQTTRMTGQDFTSTSGRMLDLNMTSGPLDIELESDYQKLIQYRADPLEVMIYDDWSMLSSTVPIEERRVRLAFTVRGTEVLVIMNVGTIPKLVQYGNKFKANLETQREGARRESKAFRIADAPKPHNPLSAVANAMINSARSKLKEDELGLLFVVGQLMSLKFNSLRLVVFPRTMRDPELAQFIGTDIHARLDRLVESETLPAKRDLHLSFSSMTISRISHLNHTLAMKEDITDNKRWLSLLVKDALEATIFGLPSMDVRMRSEETVTDEARMIGYDFSSKFSTKEGAKDPEDIYVSLNMSLYSWLTVLRKHFARDMDQAQTSVDPRAGTIGLVQPVIQRKKAPEALPLAHDPSLPSVFDFPAPGQRSTKSLFPLSTAQSYTPPALMDATYGPSTLLSPTLLPSPTPPSPIVVSSSEDMTAAIPPAIAGKKTANVTYQPHNRHIERLTMRQLGEATPDVMHPFFMKKAGFSLEDSLPQYVHEYATLPTEEIMKALLKLYSKQLRTDNTMDRSAKL